MVAWCYFQTCIAADFNLIALPHLRYRLGYGSHLVVEGDYYKFLFH